MTKAVLTQIFKHADLLSCDGVKVIGIETGNLMVPDAYVISLVNGNDIIAGVADQEITVTNGEFTLIDGHGKHVLFETYMFTKTSDLGLGQ